MILFASEIPSDKKFFDKEKKQKKKESPCVGGVAKKPKGNGISPEG